MLKRALLVSLNAVGADNRPPSAFRLFSAGVNDTTKGRVIFDEVAARSVMSHYAKHGVRLAVDLEHLSLDPRSPNYDPNARGWFDLELRSGELWAVNVNWLADGERRLAEKTQAFISPAFYVDKDGRITKILNVGLVAMPATYGAEQLVAANQRLELNSTMDPELLKKAIEAIKNGAGDEALTILEGLIVTAAGGDASQPDPTPDPSVAAMTELTGAADAPAALSVLKAWKASHDASLEQARVVALSERKALAGKLVTLGAETPATAYVETAGKRELVERLVSEPIDSLRTRVAALSAAKNPEKKPENPPANGETLQFSALDVAGAKKLGITPAEFVAKKNAAVRTSK